MRDLKRDVLQIVFAGAAKGDGGRTWLTRRGRSGGEGIVALCEEAARDRAGLGDFGGRTFGDEVAASGTGFGAHFQNPVAGLQYVEVVFHDDERVASFREAMEQAEEDGSLQTQEVTLIYEGKEHKITVQPSETILEAALEADLDIPYSCQAGMCTACMGLCQSGKVGMDEEDGLTPGEIAKGYILTCVAHPLSAGVVIDLD